MIKNDEKLIEMLLEKGMIRSEDFLKVQKESSVYGINAIDYMLLFKMTNEEDLYTAMAEAFDLRFVSLLNFSPDKTKVVMDESIVRGDCLAPLFKDGGSITVAISDPFEIRNITKLISSSQGLPENHVTLFLATPNDIGGFLDRFYPDTGVNNVLNNIAEKIEEDIEKENI